MRQLTYLSKTKYIAEQRAPILTHNHEHEVVTILQSSGSDPFKFWSTEVGQGSIKRITSKNIVGLVIEMTTLAPFCTTYISLPEDPRQKIGTSMPFLNLVMEYLNQPFSFEFQVRDSHNMKRKYRMSTCKKSRKLSPLLCHMPLKVNHGWNKIQVDLQYLTNISYNSYYIELLGLQIYSNCRLRIVYFSDKKYQEFELPDNYRLKPLCPRYVPLQLGQDVA